MNLSNENIKKIHLSFNQMRTKDDLLTLINYVGNLLYEKDFTTIQLKKLTYYANHQICTKRYINFELPKKKPGETRQISKPVGTLKAIQKCLKVILETIYCPAINVTGFVKGRSVVDNSRFHIGKNYVYNIDLKDFFHSIHLHRIKACLLNEPFNLSKTHAQEDLAYLIARLCTHPIIYNNNNIEALPQGAPTSPILSNIVCQRLDRRLNGLAKKMGISYSRYADDITFSSNQFVYSQNSEFKQELIRIINDQNFLVNEAKIRLQNKNCKQQVTGITVNKKSNLRKTYIKNIRTVLVNWEKSGLVSAQKKFLSYNNKTNERKSTFLPSIIRGKLDYLKMVKGETDPVYLKLRTRFDILVNTSDALTKKSLTNIIKNKSVNELQTKSEHLSDLYHNKTTKTLASTDNVIKSSINYLPKIHDPKRLIDLLNQFSLNSSTLKFSTHNWDYGQVHGFFRSHKEFIRKAIKQYKSFSFELFTLNANLTGKVFGFIQNENVSEKGWGIYRIKFGWSSPELSTWCENNPSKNPMEMIIPKSQQFIIKGQQITTFRQIVNIFKQDIEIREEGNQLKKIFLELEDKHNMSFNFKISHVNLEQKSFFTDVQWFTTVLDLVYESMAKRVEFPEIIVTAEDNGNNIIITVTQVNSFNELKSYKDESFSGNSGDIGSILKYLTNLCDWSIVSKFSEGIFKINYLSTVENCPSFEQVNKCNGFTNIFTFYKPKINE